MNSLSIPAAPSGDDVEVVAWVLVAIVVVLVMGLVLALRSVRPVLHEVLEHLGIVSTQVGRIDDAVNHRHPGQPRLADHVQQTRAAVERIERKVEDLDDRNEKTHGELLGDVSALKSWARRWDDLPPELSHDGGLVARFDSIESKVDRNSGLIEGLHQELTDHVAWEMAEKYGERIEAHLDRQDADAVAHAAATDAMHRELHDHITTEDDR